MKSNMFNQYEIQAFLEDKLINNTASDQEEVYYIELKMNNYLTYDEVYQSIVRQMKRLYNE